AARNRIASGTDDQDVIALMKALASARQRLAAVVVRGSRGDSGDAYRLLLEEARRARDRAERDLAEKRARFRSDQGRSRVGFGEIAAALPDGTALVAFVRFRRHDLDPGVRNATTVSDADPFYVAFVLRGGDTVPAAVPLGRVTRVDELILRWRRQLDE